MYVSKTEPVILFVSCKLVNNEVITLETISISFEKRKMNLFISRKEKNKNFKNNNPTVTTFPENIVTPLIINMFFFWLMTIGNSMNYIYTKAYLWINNSLLFAAMFYHHINYEYIRNYIYLLFKSIKFWCPSDNNFRS